MAELFIEWFGEEIPARMQARAEHHMAETFAAKLADHNLGGTHVRSWSTPRRLAVAFTDVESAQKAQTNEKRGPRVGAPEQALNGFLSSLGLTRDQLEERETAKGQFYFAMIHQSGQQTADLLPDLVNSIIAAFPWPKSQRWAKGEMSWVRPLHRINVLFDGEPVAGYYDLGGGEGISYGKTSHGHRFLAPVDLDLTKSNSKPKPLAETYDELMMSHHVMAHRDSRRAAIHEQMNNLAAAANIKILEDNGLLDEVTGLVEWPHAIMGQIDDDFMSLPTDILVLTMRSHQKYFALTDEDGELAAAFITISNMSADKTRDNMIRKGNERVLRARLSDARFLWDQDRRTSLADHAGRLNSIAYFDGLGSMQDRVDRMRGIAARLAADIPGINAEMIDHAARLAKADLVTGTVGEFPELQGIMGGHLARAEGLADAIADAVSDHYKPVGGGDTIPQTALGQGLALADKLDMLTSFFSIGKKPTGSGDPFGLRRAALGAIRILDEAQIDLNLTPLFGKAKDDLLVFMADRLHVYCRDRGLRYDVVRAVMQPDQLADFNVLAIITRIRALDDYLTHDDGQRFMPAWRRVHSILESEQATSHADSDGNIDISLFSDQTEQRLYDAIIEFDKHGDDTSMLATMTTLIEPINAFFEAVKVNDDDQNIRHNRLQLLSKIDEAVRSFARLAEIEG
ncbi:MAG: glycine--tRNA ligase subunit beta [Alphaproteobacteria bacterium]|nr:glycine--tRNA ligase subunit beta [Alphaproteobacteria bacterium]